MDIQSLSKIVLIAENVKKLLESLKDATQQSKVNGSPKHRRVPLVTSIAKMHADSAAPTLLIQSLSFLSGPEVLLSNEWYSPFSDYGSHLILQRGILDAIIDSVELFPHSMTPEIRCKLLGTVGNIVPQGAGWNGPEREDYTEYASLTAKILARDTRSLDKLLAEEKEAENKEAEGVRLGWDMKEFDELYDENERRDKKIWFSAGDIFTEAIRFLAALKGKDQQESILERFLSACSNSYSGGRCPNVQSPIDGNFKGELAWLEEATKLQKAAWRSMGQ